jgi:hypothetical protein
LANYKINNGEKQQGFAKKQKRDKKKAQKETK